MVNDFGNSHDSDSQKRIILTLGCHTSTRIREWVSQWPCCHNCFEKWYLGRGAFVTNKDWPGVIKIIQKIMIIC